MDSSDCNLRAKQQALRVGFSFLAQRIGHPRRGVKPEFKQERYRRWMSWLVEQSRCAAIPSGGIERVEATCQVLRAMKKR
jgi:hypothetical protein